MPTNSTGSRVRRSLWPGVAELICNALDAEAETVTVTIGRTPLDGVDEVAITTDVGTPASLASSNL